MSGWFAQRKVPPISQAAYGLRMYTVHAGRMNDWLQEWTESVYPLRLEFGFDIVGA